MSCYEVCLIKWMVMVILHHEKCACLQKVLWGQTEYKLKQGE